MNMENPKFLRSRWMTPNDNAANNNLFFQFLYVRN